LKKIIIALDIGYGNTKLVFGREPSAWSDLCFRSTSPKVTTPQGDMSKGFAGALDRVTVQIGGSNYLVGPEAHISGGGAILSTDFVDRPEYLALLRGSLFYAMKKTGEVFNHIDVLVLGLPVSNWQPKQAALTQLGSGPHAITVPMALRSAFGEQVDVTVGKVLVLPQPMGALHYANHCLSAENKLKPTGVHMVIDPGYNTFDWFVSVGLRPDLQRCGSLQGGVSQLLKLVANAAGSRLGVGTLNLLEVERGLETGIMQVHGQKLNMDEFKPMVQTAADQVVDRFINSIDMSLGVSTIQLAGGGASFYLEALRKAFKGYDISVPDASVMANARGFYLVGEAMSGIIK
jgi:plasmid segregation protein ParM